MSEGVEQGMTSDVEEREGIWRVDWIVFGFKDLFWGGGLGGASGLVSWWGDGKNAIKSIDTSRSSI